jgi:hypothetical protein
VQRARCRRALIDVIVTRDTRSELGRGIPAVSHGSPRKCLSPPRALSHHMNASTT